MDLIITWSSRQEYTFVFSECQGSASEPILGTLTEGHLHSSAIGLQHTCAPFEK